MPVYELKAWAGDMSRGAFEAMARDQWRSKAQQEHRKIIPGTTEFTTLPYPNTDSQHYGKLLHYGRVRVE